LFNAHRLPLQPGSYLLNRDLEPIWSNRSSFIQQWQTVQPQNEILPGSLRRILKQSHCQHRQISGKAAKFLNDLNTEIEIGWTDYGQTNYLIGRITMRTYIFHHVIEDDVPLEGKALVDQIIKIAKSLPGYKEWCQHQHEIEHRATEWVRCIESSHYFHYGSSDSQIESKAARRLEAEPGNLSWNQQQLQNTRERIRLAIADLLNQNALPVQATARFKQLTAMGIGGGSLYRHKDLWHPEFLTLNAQDDQINQTQIVDRGFDQPLDASSNPKIVPVISTSLLPTTGSNALAAESYSDSEINISALTDGNVRQRQPSGLTSQSASKSTEIDAFAN
jgi:hypothetical protein